MDRPRSTTSYLLSVAVALLVPMATAHAAGTPEQQCQAGKNKTAGKYAACRQNAEAKRATTGDATKYGETLTKCATKLTSTWQKAIDKAAAAGATCLDDPFTASDFQTVIDEQTDTIATALGGGALADCPADFATCEGDLAACEAAPQGQLKKTAQIRCYDVSGTLIVCAGTGQDGEWQKGLARSYTDNDDGTITDNRTGLMWEKLSADGSIHDGSAVYTWTNAFAVKIATLNSTTFAGYSDWRLPNRWELESLVNLRALPAVDAAFNMACTNGCTVSECSCTPEEVSWSATTATANAGPVYAWAVDSFDGAVRRRGKTELWVGRGVRGG